MRRSNFGLNEPTRDLQFERLIIRGSVLLICLSALVGAAEIWVSL